MASFKSDRLNKLFHEYIYILDGLPVISIEHNNTTLIFIFSK
jgi:hypothetical protein